MNVRLLKKIVQRSLPLLRSAETLRSDVQTDHADSTNMSAQPLPSAQQSVQSNVTMVHVKKLLTTVFPRNVLKDLHVVQTELAS